MLTLQRGARLLGIELTEVQLELFAIYQRELRRWNMKTNLISETTTEEIVTRHFLDSLTAVRYLSPSNARIVDIGTGAGFPGIPLKIVEPALQLYLLESSRKKISFLKHIIRLLKFSNISTIHERTENVIKNDEYREKFDIVISRAALKLPELMPLSDYFLAPGGLLITLKGMSVEAELDEALSTGNTSKIYDINQYDINLSLLGPLRKIIVARKAK